MKLNFPRYSTSVINIHWLLMSQKTSPELHNTCSCTWHDI